MRARNILVRSAGCLTLLLLLAAMGTSLARAGEGICVIGAQGGECHWEELTLSFPALAVAPGTWVRIENNALDGAQQAATPTTAFYTVSGITPDHKLLVQFAQPVDVWFVDGSAGAREKDSPVDVLTWNAQTGLWTTDNVSSASQDANGRVHFMLAAPARIAIVPRPAVATAASEPLNSFRLAEGLIEWLALGLAALLLGLGIVRVLRNPIAG